MSYATPSDLLARYDTRRVGQLVNDDGTQAPASALLGNSVVQAALDDGAALIDAATLAGGKYLPPDPTTGFLGDLAGLVGTSRNLLLRINCDLAYGLLVERRGLPQADVSQAAPGFARALALLDKLREGGWVFAVPAAILAGQVQNVAIDSRLTPLSSVSRIFGDLVVDPNNPGSTYPYSPNLPARD